MASTSKKNESSVLFDQPGPKGLRTIHIANIIAAAVFAVVLVLILMRLAAPPDGENQLSWELWKPALEAEAWTDFYLPGLWMTLQASILAVIGAVAFGLVFGIGRLLPNPLLRGVSAVVVEFCRAVPVLLMMIFFWRGFAFPRHRQLVVLGRGAGARAVQRVGGGRAGAFRRRQPAERPARGVAGVGSDRDPVADADRGAAGRVRHAARRGDPAGRRAQGHRARLDHHVHRSACRNRADSARCTSTSCRRWWWPR